MSRDPPPSIAPGRLQVMRLSTAILVALLALLVWLGVELHALRGERATNASIARGAFSDLAGEDSSRGRLARGYIAQSSDRLDEALEAYGQVGELGSSPLARALRFNLGNLYLARAAEFERQGEKRLSISLIEQAKQNYRELLALDPGFWDARYNLSRALEMLPDLEDVHYGEEVNPERSPQAPQADTAYERLP